jgi:hypothetical protein
MKRKDAKAQRRKGEKRSHLPTLSPLGIFEHRAVVAWRLSTEHALKIPNIRAVLRCKGPDEVRRLIARGARVANKMMDGKMIMKRKILVIVNGTPLEMELDPEAWLFDVRREALERAGCTGHGYKEPREWELRDAAGYPISATTRVRDVTLPEDKLVVQLPAGIGG